MNKRLEKNIFKKRLFIVNELISFQRDDGSILTLTPRMQLNSEQEYEVIRNEMTGNLVRIPIYEVSNEEYKSSTVIS